MTHFSPKELVHLSVSLPGCCGSPSLGVYTPVLVRVCDPPPLARSRHLPALASSHPADRGAGALLDHSSAREYCFPTRNTQSWLSLRWSFILLPHRWTWLDCPCWSKLAGTGGTPPSWAPDHRGDTRHVAEANHSGYFCSSLVRFLLPGITNNRGSYSASEAVSQPINGCAAQH
jgi:hypothetical protein